MRSDRTMICTFFIRACVRCRLGYFKVWVMISEIRKERNAWVSTDRRGGPDELRLDERSMISLANEIVSVEAPRSYLWFPGSYGSVLSELRCVLVDPLTVAQRTYANDHFKVSCVQHRRLGSGQPFDVVLRSRLLRYSFEAQTFPEPILYLTRLVGSWEDAPSQPSILIGGDGGLNIGSLKACNWALLGKWWWRFQGEGDRLWIKIIKSIYGTNGGLSGMLERRSNRLSESIWGDIIRVGKDIDKIGINFCSSFGKMVGNGYNTRFLLDRWVGEGVLLCEKFPRLFRLETNKDESVGEKRVWGEEGWEWQWNWAREPRGRGEDDLMELTALTNFFVPNVLQVDSWRWLLDKNGQFTVKCLREKIDEKKILISTNSTKETKWSKIIPRKICIFIWRLQQRRLPMLTWLQHIAMDLNSTLCPHYEDDIERLIIAS
ncbi:hypothetical protein Tco_0355535 [Tanacetum coccineum]